MPTGMRPFVEVRFRFRETVPSGVVLPEDKIKECVCPNETFAATKNAAVSKGATLFLKKSSDAIEIKSMLRNLTSPPAKTKNRYLLRCPCDKAGYGEDTVAVASFE